MFKNSVHWTKLRNWRLSQIRDCKILSRVQRDSDPRKVALARASSMYKRQTRPLVREGAPRKQDRNCQKLISIWSWAPDGCFVSRQTGRLTVGRNIRLRLRLSSEQRQFSSSSEQSQFRSHSSTTDIATVKNQKTSHCFLCYIFVKWIITARQRKGANKTKCQTSIHKFFVTLPR
jgi:hypothetical protein